MTCVIPAAHIAEILNQTELLAMRAQREQRLLRQIGSKPLGPKAESAAAAVVSNTDPPASELDPNGRERFNSLLDAAVRKPGSKD
jgi:hypothetical protein